MTYQPIVKRTLAVAVLAAAGGLLSSSCADNESSLYIRGCKLRQADTCGVDNDPSGDYVGKGLADAAFFGEFKCALLVGNQLVERGSSDLLRTETSRIELYEAEVRVVDPSGTPIGYADGSAVEYAVPINGFIDPGTGSDPGYGLADVPMLDGGSLQSLRSLAGPGGVVDVVALVTVRGRTLGGQELETPEWPLPISVCVGCACLQPFDPVCCSDPSNAACADLDDPITTFCSASDGYDCRLLGQTCAEFIAGP